jgi:hypothetical protein
VNDQSNSALSSDEGSRNKVNRVALPPLQFEALCENSSIIGNPEIELRLGPSVDTKSQSLELTAPEMEWET